VLDGWCVEGHVEGVTGWSVDGPKRPAADSPEERDRLDADALYEKLESGVLPCFYTEPERYLEIMRHAISLNASFFNTQRMLLQYLYDAYLEPGPGCPEVEPLASQG
jgi:starch phosphorylase